MYSLQQSKQKQYSKTHFKAHTKDLKRLPLQLIRQPDLMCLKRPQINLYKPPILCAAAQCIFIAYSCSHTPPRINCKYSWLRHFVKILDVSQNAKLFHILNKYTKVWNNMQNYNRITNYVSNGYEGVTNDIIEFNIF